MSQNKARDHFSSAQVGLLSFSPAIPAGLKDSINPGALTAAFLFLLFIFYFTQNRKEVIISGVSFVVSVFLVTLLGLVGSLNSLVGSIKFDLFLRNTYFLIGGAAMIFGMVNFVDWWRCAKDHPSEKMIVPLPHFLGNEVTRSRSVALLIWGGMIAGILTAILEMSWPQDYTLGPLFQDFLVAGKTLSAFFGFCLYSFVFVLPLIVLLILFVYVFGSSQIRASLQAKKTTVKIILAALFLALGSGLIFIRLNIF